MEVESVGSILRVLIVSPIYEVFGRSVESIFNLDWPGWEDRFWPRENPTGDSYADIEYQYRKAQYVALEGGYDAMLTIESDVIAPADALVKLAETGADIAYGIYCWRHFGMRWNVTIDTEADGSAKGSLSDYPGRAREWWGTVQPATGLGFGCTLIRRNVLERIPLQCTERRHPDTFLAKQANKLGLRQAMHLGVICGHIRRDPVAVVWPDLEAEKLYRIEKLV